VSDPLTLGLIAAAFLTATLSGVAGLGGGTILIGLFYALGLPPLEAIPLFAAVQLASNASRTVAYMRHVHWGATGWFLLASIPATFVLAPWIEHVNQDWMRLLLAALILLSLLPGRGGKGIELPARTSFIVAGLLNGGLGLFVGATGVFVGRLFLRPDWRKETTIGTLAMTQALGHLLRGSWLTVGPVSARWRNRVDCCRCGVAVVAGTLVGRRLNAQLDEARFAQLFKLLLIAMSLKLVWDGVRALLGH